LISNGTVTPNDIEVRFYGHEEFWLQKEIERYKLSDIVKQYGIIPREISLKKQWESQILLLFKWEDPKVKGGYSGKVFEYLAAKRPILAIGGTKDVVTDLLNETNVGIDAPCVKDIKNAIEKFYTGYKQIGKVSYYGEWKEIQKYSQREMARKFAYLLNQLK
jgi:hypothetical protein